MADFRRDVRLLGSFFFGPRQSLLAGGEFLSELPVADVLKQFTHRRIPGNTQRKQVVPRHQRRDERRLFIQCGLFGIQNLKVVQPAMRGKAVDSVMFPFQRKGGTQQQKKAFADKQKQLAALAAKVDASVEPDGESYEDD